jgi:drug/metabolite transporter (DMT)-like permease
MTIHLKLLLATMFWGATPTIGRVLASYEAPFIVVFGRFVVAAMCLLFLMQLGRHFKKVPKSLWWKFLILGASGILLHNGLLYEGLESVTASHASILLALIAIQVTILEAIASRRLPTVMTMVGVLFGFFGVVYVITDGDIYLLGEIAFRRGEILVFCSGLSWAIYSVVGKDLLRRYRPIVVTTYAALVGLIFLFPFAVADIAKTVAIYSDPKSIGLIFFLGSFGSALAFVWYYQAVAQIGVISTSLYVNFVPIFGVLSAHFFLNEPLVNSLFTGGMIVFIGLIIVTLCPSNIGDGQKEEY